MTGEDKSIEELRSSYRPARVHILFIGESPPANGTFFYLGNSNLWRYTRQAFENIYGNTFSDCQSFGHFFASKGCYLEDLCLEPVNHMGDTKRRIACAAGVDSLAERIRLLSPQIVVCIKKSVACYIKSAMDKAGLRAVPLYTLPFPSCSHQREYKEQLVELIREVLWMTR